MSLTTVEQHSSTNNTTPLPLNHKIAKNRHISESEGARMTSRGLFNMVHDMYCEHHRQGRHVSSSRRLPCNMQPAMRERLICHFNLQTDLNIYDTSQSYYCTLCMHSLSNRRMLGEARPIPVLFAHSTQAVCHLYMPIIYNI